METVARIFKDKRPISFEVFPPKGELTLDAAKETLAEISSLEPDFISVTCSAAGVGDKRFTDDIACMVQRDFRIPSVAHITCSNQDERSLKASMENLKAKGIATVLALRGDLPKGEKSATDLAFPLAIDMIPILKNEGFCVGGAAYPEGHTTCFSSSENIKHLAAKQDAGVDYFVTQLAFSNDAILSFLDEARNFGIDAPITIGIMPFTSKSQITRMIFMCGASMPSAVVKILSKYEDDPVSLRSAGVEYACRQIEGLMERGVDGIHIYTMNNPDIAKAVMGACRHA